MIELHTFRVLDRDAQSLPLFHGHETVAPDSIHHLADEFANASIPRGNRRDFRHLLSAGNRRRRLSELLNYGAGGFFQASLEDHGVGASDDVAVPFRDHCVGEHGGGCGAVTGNVIGLARGLYQELRAHVLEVVDKLYLFGYGDTVVLDDWDFVLIAQAPRCALWGQAWLGPCRQPFLCRSSRRDAHLH